jgi:hypothetical protein
VVDEKIALESRAVAAHSVFGWKRDRLGDAMKRRVSGHGVGRILGPGVYGGLDSGRHKGGSGKLADDKIGRLEIIGQATRETGRRSESSTHFVSDCGARHVSLPLIQGVSCSLLRDWTCLDSDEAQKSKAGRRRELRCAVVLANAIFGCRCKLAFARPNSRVLHQLFLPTYVVVPRVGCG